MSSEGLTLSRGDLAHLERARALSHRAWGHVHPNPLVGCVIVRDGIVIGEGCHEVFGGPHAEIVALEAAGVGATGATVYVTLEPCNHQGKTPPCAEALVQAGVRRVVFGARDPGSLSGGGAERLRAAGIIVEGPAWSDAEGRAENPAFFHTSREASPYVALKLAMSLDACLAARPGDRTRLTGPEADREVHRLRTGFDAVMVGAGTVSADNPRLTPRLVPPGRALPRRVLLDSDGTLPSDAAVFQDRDRAPVHVFVRREVSEAAIERLEEAGAHVHPVHRSEGGLDFGEVLTTCWDLGIHSIFCEGGSRVAGGLLRERRVHRLCLFVSPVTFGAEGLRAFPEDAHQLVWSDFEMNVPPRRFGPDTLLVYDRQDPVGARL